METEEHDVSEDFQRFPDSELDVFHDLIFDLGRLRCFSGHAVLPAKVLSHAGLITRSIRSRCRDMG